MACELPTQHDLPLARFSTSEIARQAVAQGLVASLSGTTVWRWLSADAICPWRHRCWIFPRDPAFAEKAGVVLDLYQRYWRGKRLRDDEYVLSADEKTSIQARARCHPRLLPAPKRVLRYEHEYVRKGAWAYLAAWEVGRARLSGRCETSTGIEPFHRLVDQTMQQEPYRSARRVFWIADGGSSHRGEAAAVRLQTWYPNAVLVPTPVHASGLNQIEIYFSMVQRKVLTPNDLADLQAAERRLLDFERHYEKIATPFEWKFTRDDLHKLLDKLGKNS
ncbi:MAG TPA: transposase [Blastocatellia bacterium]|nr:transposase [Blastocatellia bacterium]